MIVQNAPAGFYGWPFSYYGQPVDTRVKSQRPDLVAQAIAPDYALGPQWGSRMRQGRRCPADGYKVIFVP
jgi:glucose/arabinose dehydrogenase